MSYVIALITDADLLGLGVTALPDVPEISSEDLKRKFEEILRDVAIPKINEVVAATNDLQTIAEMQGLITQGDFDRWDAKADNPTMYPACTIAVEDWGDGTDTTLPDYGYKASIPAAGITADMYASVIFTPADATRGILASVCETADNEVFVFSKSLPESAVSVLGVLALEVQT